MSGLSRIMLGSLTQLADNLNHHDEIAKESRKQINSVDEALPDVDSRVRIVLMNVASHYGCGSCVLALRRQSLLHVVAVNSKGQIVFRKDVGLIDQEEFQLYHHHIDRSLPTIIFDAAGDWRLKSDPCVIGIPHVRFYAASPIYLSQNCLGTLCIIDDMPKVRFDLDEAQYLCDQARLVAGLVHMYDREPGLKKACVASEPHACT
eukprot:TRINITY_DN58692_c0_g1_i1.p1 TRINITY_DN58692_c0_g1~~TRINITY_DN58692_c0_g1_i1.p1  ORF type:complete len:205 (+),score=28.18 TRINITY_DN58692_c0_g1_i1:58-672(+)